MASGKRKATSSQGAMVHAGVDGFDEWWSEATGELIAGGASEEGARVASALIWNAACHYTRAVQRPAKPARFKPSTRKELARAANALVNAREALDGLGSEALEILRWEARRPRINRLALLAHGSAPEEPAHPNAAEIVERLHNNSPLELVDVMTGTTLVRPYAPSLVGDMEVLARVADSAAALYRARPGSRPSHGSPFLKTCIGAWQSATGRFPVKTRDTDDAKNSPKIAPLYKVMMRALDAIEPRPQGWPGIGTTSFFYAICEAEASEKDRAKGPLFAAGASLAREKARKTSRRAGKAGRVSK